MENIDIHTTFKKKCNYTITNKQAKEKKMIYKNINLLMFPKSYKYFSLFIISKSNINFNQYLQAFLILLFIYFM